MIFGFGAKNNINRADATCEVKAVYPKGTDVDTGWVVGEVIRLYHDVLADVFAINLFREVVFRKYKISCSDRR